MVWLKRSILWSLYKRIIKAKSSPKLCLYYCQWCLGLDDGKTRESKFCAGIEFCEFIVFVIKLQLPAVTWNEIQPPVVFNPLFLRSSVTLLTIEVDMGKRVQVGISHTPSDVGNSNRSFLFLQFCMND